MASEGMAPRLQSAELSDARPIACRARALPVEVAAVLLAIGATVEAPHYRPGASHVVSAARTRPPTPVGAHARRPMCHGPQAWRLGEGTLRSRGGTATCEAEAYCATPARGLLLQPMRCNSVQHPWPRCALSNNRRPRTCLGFGLGLCVGRPMRTEGEEPLIPPPGLAVSLLVGRRRDLSIRHPRPLASEVVGMCVAFP